MHIRKSILTGLLVLAVAGGWLAKTIAQEKASSTSVTYFDHKKVDAALANPSFNVLFGGKSGEANYTVMMASRDRPGEVEIHNLDTDVFYMLNGTATLVTGGTAVEAKTTAPDEIRGKSIEGGDSRRLSKGDVIIIPHGVPHWFKDVEGPLHYFVVKVR